MIIIGVLLGIGAYLIGYAHGYYDLLREAIKRDFAYYKGNKHYWRK